MPEFSARTIVQWMNRTKKETPCLAPLIALMLSQLADKTAALKLSRERPFARTY